MVVGWRLCQFGRSLRKSRTRLVSECCTGRSASPNLAKLKLPDTITGWYTKCVNARGMLRMLCRIWRSVLLERIVRCVSDEVLAAALRILVSSVKDWLQISPITTDWIWGRRRMVSRFSRRIKSIGTGHS